MKDILSFLEELKVNNNREWFETNRSRYKEINAQFNEFTELLINGITLFDSSIIGVTAKDSTYRIYRDVRFSPNKEPYKTHIGAYICRGGKKSGFAGYYFHLEPQNSILAVGLHCPEPKVVRSIRQEICDNGFDLQTAIDEATGFVIDQSSKLQRVPREFANRETIYSDYLKLKEFDLIKPLTVDHNTLNNTLLDFSRAKKFNDILNKAVDFAMENI